MLYFYTSKGFFSLLTILHDIPKSAAVNAKNRNPAALLKFVNLHINQTDCI